MQHDKDDNCYYCGYGPQNRSPLWNKGVHKCKSSHIYDTIGKAKNVQKWEMFLAPAVGERVKIVADELAAKIGGGVKFSNNEVARSDLDGLREIRDTLKKCICSEKTAKPASNTQPKTPKGYYTPSAMRRRGMKNGKWRSIN